MYKKVINLKLNYDASADANITVMDTAYGLFIHHFYTITVGGDILFRPHSGDMFAKKDFNHFLLSHRAILLSYAACGAL